MACRTSVNPRRLNNYNNNNNNNKNDNDNNKKITSLKKAHDHANTIKYDTTG